MRAARSRTRQPTCGVPHGSLLVGSLVTIPKSATFATMSLDMNTLLLERTSTLVRPENKRLGVAEMAVSWQQSSGRRDGQALDIAMHETDVVDEAQPDGALPGDAVSRRRVELASGLAVDVEERAALAHLR